EGEGGGLEARLWVLEMSISSMMDTSRSSMQALFSGNRTRRPRFSFGGGLPGGSKKPLGITHWKLIEPAKEGLVLSEVGLEGGEKVMLEVRDKTGEWPREKYLETRDFRNFTPGSVGRRVDAMDYQGRWYPGQ
ncbi:unnamed protein product, partial [Discosporangium mesarthrocarpum]